MNPDRPEIRRFLSLLRTRPPWDLVFIHAESGKVQGRSPIDIDAAADVAVRANNAGFNCYFSVARLLVSLGGRTQKAREEHVESLAFLYVDIDDPSPVVLHRLTAHDHAFPPPPTGVTFSGGGHQAFWRLREPFQIGGDAERAAEIKRVIYGLGRHLGGDSVQNVDRVMRVVGTVNIPGKRKAARGRAPAMATIVSWDNALRYDLGAFACCAKDPPGKVGSRVVAPVVIDLPAELPVLCPDLVENLNTHIREYYPRENWGEKSRSEWQAAVSRAWAEADLDDAEHVAALLDPRVIVSEAILVGPNGNPRGNALRYARRQVGQARAWTKKETTCDPT